MLNKLIVFLGSRLLDAEAGIANATLPRFAGPAPGLMIRTPREIGNPHLIHFGRDVKIGPNSVIKATTRFPGGWLKHPAGEHVSQTFTPTISFGDRVTATSALQVVAFDSITIGDDVMFAGNIYVSDGQHGTGRGDLAYKFQGIEGVAPISIGRGAWIGQNVVVLPGSTIGEFAVIGANSVVRGDIPARSMVVGAPARVVRVWDDTSAAWRKPADGTEHAATQNGKEPAIAVNREGA
ncbi:MAG: acyltransferase [Trueperaceae bacterium]